MTVGCLLGQLHLGGERLNELEHWVPLAVVIICLEKMS